MSNEQELIECIAELRGEVIAMRAAVMSVMLVFNGRAQLAVKRNFDHEAERARVALLNSANPDQQIAAFDKAVLDINRGFSALR